MDRAAVRSARTRAFRSPHPSRARMAHSSSAIRDRTAGNSSNIGETRRNASTGGTVIHYDYYTDIPDELLDAFVRDQEMGRLLTVADDGLPHLGLYPFAYGGGAIEIHLNRADEQLAHLEARPRCAFEVDEILAT